MHTLHLLYFSTKVDDEMAQQLSTLTTQFHHTHTMPNTLKYLSENNDVSAIFIDKDIEGMDSLDVVRHVRMVKKSMLCVIFAHETDQNHLLHAIELGITDYLLYPIDIFALKNMFQKVNLAYLMRNELKKKNLLLNQYKNAMDSSLVISKADPSGTITYINDKMWQLSGYTPQELIGKTHRLLKHPKRDSKQMEDLWATISSKRVWHGVIQNRAKEGHDFYTDTFVIPILDTNNEIIEYMDLRIDVTAMYQKQRHFQDVLDAQSTLIAVCDSTKISKCNKPFLKFINFKTLDAFLEKHQCLNDLLIEDDYYLHGELFESWLLGADDSNAKILLHDKHQKNRVFNVSKNHFESLDGISEIIISLNDITDLENQTLALQEKVADATKEIEGQQQQLIQQSRAAALGEMFDNIAHQWRQPIGAINAAIINAEFDIELEGLNEETIQQTFKTVNECTQFLSQTIDDFKNFSNPDKTMQEFFVHKAIKNTLSIIRGAYSMNSITLNYEPNEALKNLEVYGYFGELTQVILNILSNAKDVLLERSINNATASILLYEKDNQVVIEICDNAGGIDDTIVSKIFDPYFTTKHKSQGTGIGLYMSQRIIEENFNGVLKVVNRDEGACFIIALPKWIMDNG